MSLSLPLSLPPSLLHTDEDGSVSFEEFTEYMARLSLMESRTESPDTNFSDDDFPLPVASVTTPTLEVATVVS